MKKTALISITAAAMAGILLVGTWAYLSANNNSNGGLTGSGGLKIGATLHDDQYVDKTQLKADIAASSDPAEVAKIQEKLEARRVYVENWGKHNIFVRIKLSEYLAFNDKPRVTPTPAGFTGILDPLPSADPKKSNTWAIRHWFEPVGDISKWALLTSGVGIAGSKYYPVSENDRLKTDADDNMWVENEFDPLNDLTGRTQKDMNPTEDIITMAKFYEAPRGNVWVVDTDGWMYWSSPVAKEETTGMLLAKMAIDEDNILDGYAYVYQLAINAQMGTLEDANPNQEGDPETYKGLFTKSEYPEYDPDDPETYPSGLKFFDFISSNKAPSKMDKVLTSIVSNKAEAQINGDYIEFTKASITNGSHTVTFTIPDASDATWASALTTGISTAGANFNNVTINTTKKILTITLNPGSGMAVKEYEVGGTLSVPSDTPGGTPETKLLKIKVV